ncbi:histidine kinase [Leptospira yasudae]|uniref:PAS domain S-box protein n=1 Tax=Leptospira yasudae TaxID=2202201 RepID=UPI000E59B5B2|nr:PAS domain S-box protein [Leptospira yasudae]RHX91533.1 histidine kinase [Leptospira yasudae]
MEETQKELNRLRNVVDCLEMLSGLYGKAVDLEEALSKILERLSQVANCLYGQAWLFDEYANSFLLEAVFLPDRSVSSSHSPQEKNNDTSLKIAPNGLVYDRFFRNQNNATIEWNVSFSHTFSVPSPLAARIGSILNIPIIDGGEIIGTFLLFLETGSELKEDFAAELSCVTRHWGGLISEKRLRRSLQESEGRMRKVLENMPILFMAVDSGFRLVSWNHECERVMGYSEKEVLGKEEFLQEKLLPESNSGSLMKMDSKIFDSDFKNWELELIAKDGKTKTIFLSNLSSEFPLPGWEKWFVGVDITHTKEIERELKGSLKELSDFQTALNAVSIVAFTDRAGTIIYVNQNFCNISGYSRDELLGQNHRIINSGYHSKEFFKDLWKTISKGKIWKGEIKNKAKDGRFYWVDTTISPILDETGKPYQYLAIRNDITERKETEEKARHAENNLKTLQDRMSPHFLFNTLSIIHSYLQTNPELADSAILMLADNYRFLTDQAVKQLVPFDVEWEFMENYLQLLKLRFSDFIDVKVEKIGNFSKCQLPPLTLQPIVENSYLHGLRNKKGKGTISVHAFIEGTKTHILIRDDGVGLKSDMIHSRTLTNISDRLKFYLYESEVKIENHPEGGTVVTVTFDKPNNEKLSDSIGK